VTLNGSGNHEDEGDHTLRPACIRVEGKGASGYGCYQFGKTFVRGVKSGRKARTVAKAETRGCSPAFHRVFDSQPRGHFGPAVSYPVRRKSALATQFRKCAAQHPSRLII
jgi:hypothetical protein